MRRGVGTMVIDARRGDGPPTAFNYTMPALITSDKLIAETPDVAAAALRALVRTHAALKQDISLATQVGRKLFPAEEAELIADVVERDLPFYTAAISPEFVQGMSEFSKAMGLIENDLTYDQVVDSQFTDIWTA